MTLYLFPGPRREMTTRASNIVLLVFSVGLLGEGLRRRDGEVL